MQMLDPKKPLHRNTSNMMVAGVCAGIADWLGWDVTLVRVLVVIVSALTAILPAMVVYLVLWIIMPPDVVA